MKPLNLAVIGAGHLGRIHARIAAGLPEAQVVVVADPSETARVTIAEETGARAVEDYRTLLDGTAESVGKIDAAIIATPTTTHHRIATDVLNAGVSVLVEKPLTRTRAEADELVKLAEQAGLTLQVGHVERFNPALSAAAPYIEDPKYIIAERCSGYPGRSLDVGVVLDLMIHDLDVILSLAQSPVRHVEALGISVLGGYEDMATARIVFASGCVANVTASRVSYAMRRAMQVYSPRSFTTLDFASGKSTVVHPNEAVLDRHVDAPSFSTTELQWLQQDLFEHVLVREELSPPSINAIEQEQREFFASLRTGQMPRVPGSAGRDALAVAEQILEAIDAHQWDGSATGRIGPFSPAALPAICRAA